MRVLWIGFGQAGGKIANSLMGMNRRLYSAIAVNTEEADLSGLRYIRDKVLIGKYSGTEVKLDGEEHLILREEEILAVIS